MSVTLTDDTPLAQVRAWLRDRIDDGAECPTCTQHAKVYRRKLTSAIARFLIAMYRADKDGWQHIPSFGTMGLSDATKARYWGLIEPQPDAGPREDGSRRVGYWRLTDAGRLFVEGKHSVPKYARVYDSRCLNLGGPPVTIREALGTKFRYDDLMAGV